MSSHQPQELPQSLYRFRPCNGEHFKAELQALLKNEAWFAPVAGLNDPAECRPRYAESDFGEFCDELEILQERFSTNPKTGLKARLIWNGHFEDPEDLALPETQLETYRSFQYQYGVATTQHIGLLEWLRGQFKSISFSSDWNNPLMWGHYANGSKGMCIEYVRDDSVRADLVFETKVQYTDHRPTLSTVEMMRYDVISKCLVSSNSEALEVQHQMAERLIATKSTNWSGEGEWRQYTLKDSDASGRNYQGVVSFRPSRIIFGLDTPEETQKLVRGVLADTVEYQQLTWAENYKLKLRSA